MEIACTGLKVAFGPVAVLNGVDLRLPAGEQVATLIITVLILVIAVDGLSFVFRSRLTGS